jgi:hypothetical protein
MSDALAGFDLRALRVFARGEAFDAKGFAGLFVEAPVYQFGNGEPCLDRPSIETSVAGFFALVEALYHDIKAIQTVGDTAFVEMDVHYWRKAGGLVTLPCLDVFRFAPDGRVGELRIGMDAGPVGEASSSTPETASVFLGANARRLDHPNPMQLFFRDTEEGRARIAQGFAPKWASAGPRWLLGQHHFQPA